MGRTDRGASSTPALLAPAGFRAHRDATHSVTAAIGAGTTHSVEVNHRADMTRLLSASPMRRATMVPRNIAYNDAVLGDEPDAPPLRDGENSPVTHQVRR
jgi:hypothetical protein